MAENNQTKKKGFKPWVILLIVAAIAVPVILKTVVQKQMSKIMGNIGTPVDVEIAETGSLSQIVELSGSVQSEETKMYFAPVTAKIESCEFQAGDLVKAGDKLVTFDVSDLQAQLETARLEEQVSTYGSDIQIKTVDTAQQKANEAQVKYDEAEAYVVHFSDAVGSIKTQLAEATALSTEQATLAAEIKEVTKALAADPENGKLKKQLKKAEKKLKEVNKKLENYNIQDLKNALEICSEDLAEYKARKEQYDAQRESDPTAGLQKQQQAVSKQLAKKSAESLEKEITKAQLGVKNEFDGVIVAAEAAEGMAVSEGMNLFTVQSTENLKVTVPVGKNDLSKIAEGQHATITISGKEYEGRVENISKVAATNASGAVTVDVDVHIEQPDEGIIIGTEGKVTIETAEKKDIVLIPMVCLNYSSDSTFVYLIKDGKLTKSEVETGISDDEMIEIVSGVSAGDEVVKSVPAEVTEGMDVIAKHEKNEEETEKEEEQK